MFSPTNLPYSCVLMPTFDPITSFCVATVIRESGVLKRWSMRGEYQMI